MTATRADAYLAIPPRYGESLGGLRWSASRDAVEDADGHTLAVVEEIGMILQGVFAAPPVPPFAYVLNLLRVMKRGEQAAVEPGLDRLSRAYDSARGATALARNTGALIAVLCPGLPGRVADLSWADVRLALSRSPAGEPAAAYEPLARRDLFERAVAVRLHTWDEAALVHWLKFGGPPGAAGAALAEPVESLPVRVAKLLAEARRRPRLAGAAALVAALDAAVTIPPRRQSPDAVPQGGYADVTTRGDPERLLPAQFALDPDDFVRRFAERELLYFKREEPRATDKPERVLVVDQGVRTWGGVRLALAAAVLALVGKDAKRHGPARLVFSSADDPVDAAGFDPERLADRLEASDLTPQPAEALRRELTAGGDRPRDVILLTHPRNLREPAVIEAAGRRPTDRLFALSVDERGRAEFAEWTAGGPVPVRAFRVDLVAAEAAEPSGEPADAPGSDGAWGGDAEPIGFPFRPGLLAEPKVLGFDAEGEWLVAAGRDGTLHGIALDGAPPEVLPRAFRGGEVLKQIDAVLAVSGGVVVCGRMPRRGGGMHAPISPAVTVTFTAPLQPVVTSAASDSGPKSATFAAEPAGSDFAPTVFVAAHYDRASRRVRLHDLGPAPGPGRWFAYPDIHSVAVRQAAAGVGMLGAALDLATGARYPRPGGVTEGDRALSAWERSAGGGGPPYVVPVVTTRPAIFDDSGPYLQVERRELRVRRTGEPWTPFTPARDGQPLLAIGQVERAELAGSVLVVSLIRPKERSLVLFRGPEGATIAELPLASRGTPFRLSPDGRLLARRTRDSGLQVTATIGSVPLRATAQPARLHNNLGVLLADDPFRLVVGVGGNSHTFRVVAGTALLYALNRNADPVPGSASGDGAASPHPTRYDPFRFPAGEIRRVGRWRAVLDRFGQVLLYADDSLVASFLIRRDKAAAWTPGGVFWGDLALIGGPPTPDAARIIGRAIMAAGRES